MSFDQPSIVARDPSTETYWRLLAIGLDPDRTAPELYGIVDSRRRALHAIADYCTTSKDLTKYLEEVGDHSSRELVDAVLWCVGAVVVKTRIM